MRAYVDDSSQLGCGDVKRGDAAHGQRRGLAGQKDRRFATFVGEQLGLEDAAAGADGGDVLGGQGGVQFPERSQVPGEGVGAVHDLRDRRCGDGAGVAVPDLRQGGRPLEQVAERGHGVLGAG